jgi:hypothetical protein
MNNLTALLQQATPSIVKQYKNRVHYTYENLVRVMGGTNFNSVYNRKEIFQFRAIAGCLINRQQSNLGCAPSDYRVDEQRIDEVAARHAEATIIEWAMKITAKVNELTNHEVFAMDSTSFTIRGHRNGHAVVIEQQMIINVSSRGILFNQFPARIYVDGKFISEAKYKTMFA